jgi:hypothetical protein
VNACVGYYIYGVIVGLAIAYLVPYLVRRFRLRWPFERKS